MDQKKPVQTLAPTQTNPINQSSLKPEEALLAADAKKMDCRYCKFPVKDNFYFCPNCGKKLKEPPFKFSLLKTIGLIIFSILLPPFGLVPGFKYLFKKNAVAKIIGILLIIISIVMTVTVVLFIQQMINDMTRFYSELYSAQGGKNYYENVTPENVMNQLNSLQEISR